MYRAGSWLLGEGSVFLEIESGKRRRKVEIYLDEADYGVLEEYSEEVKEEVGVVIREEIEEFVQELREAKVYRSRGS